MSICVVGAGAWGTALAATFARAGPGTGASVTLWGRDAETVAAIEAGTNPRYLPGIDLPPIRATTDLASALDGADIVLLVIPVAATRAIVPDVLAEMEEGATIICCSKGIDPERGETPAAIVRGHAPEASVAVLSGPSFAADVARGLPTAVTLAADDREEALRLAGRLSNPTLRLYAHDDPPGAELGGALKNVLALAVGVARGLELGASAEAALIARGFSELTRIATALGARRETLTGLSGLGDLVLSCSSPQSRNFRYGMTLGQGGDTTGLELAEGVRTASTAARISRERGLDCAIVEGVDRLLRGDVEPHALVHELLERPLRAEVN